MPTGAKFKCLQCSFEVTQDATPESQQETVVLIDQHLLDNNTHEIESKLIFVSEN